MVSRRSRKSERELRAMLAEATEMVPTGSIWQHFKGDKYKVICIAFDEITLNFEVVYVPLKHPDIHFTRMMSVWLESVEWNGYTVPRFERIES